MKTFKFKLYQHKRNRKLHRKIDAASSIYNHCIALHKRYYRLYKKPLSANKLKALIAKKRRNNQYWQLVGSQAVQDVIERIEATNCFSNTTAKGLDPRTSRSE